MSARDIIAGFQHRNESLHRHGDLHKDSCSYCRMAATNALTALRQAAGGADLVVLHFAEEGVSVHALEPVEYSSIKRTKGIFKFVGVGTTLFRLTNPGGVS